MLLYPRPDSFVKVFLITIRIRNRRPVLITRLDHTSLHIILKERQRQDYGTSGPAGAAKLDTADAPAKKLKRKV